MVMPSSEVSLATGRELLISVGDVAHPAAINEIKLLIIVKGFILGEHRAESFGI
jgi:hypothetical protein